MATFVLLALTAVLAQAPSAQPKAPIPRPPEASVASSQTLDEVVITAPRRRPDPQYNVVAGSGAREFEAEVARKEQMRRYRETGSLKDYPGLRCAMFHRC